MKICLLTRFFNRRNAGIGQYSQNLLREMLMREHEVDPVCTTHRGTIGYFLYTSAEIKFRIPHDVDVYHALTPLEAIWTPKEKTVTTFHDLIPWLYRKEETWYFSGFAIPFRRWFGSKWFELAAGIAARSKRIICNSEQTKREIMEHLNIDEDKITVTRLGISRDLKPDPSEHDNYRVGTLSYIDPRKRIDVLIEAVKSINDDLELLIAGKGKDRPRLERMADGDPRIKFIGFVPEENKSDFLNSLDVFVFTSKLEGYGIPIVEAMACGIPVVTLDDALIPNDVKMRTHITNRENLAEVLESRDFDCDLRANLEFAREHDWSKMADETETVYREALE